MTTEHDPAPSSLKAFVGAARWFGGKGREFRVSDLRRLGWLGEGGDGARVRIELATIDYADGGQD